MVVAFVVTAVSPFVQVAIQKNWFLPPVCLWNTNANNLHFVKIDNLHIAVSEYIFVYFVAVDGVPEIGYYLLSIINTYDLETLLKYFFFFVFFYPK